MYTKRKFSPEVMATMCQLHKEGMSINKICKMYKTGFPTVKRIIVENGQVTRPNKDKSLLKSLEEAEQSVHDDAILSETQGKIWY